MHALPLAHPSGFPWPGGDFQPKPYKSWLDTVTTTLHWLLLLLNTLVTHDQLYFKAYGIQVSVKTTMHTRTKRKQKPSYQIVREMTDIDTRMIRIKMRKMKHLQVSQ